MSPSFPAPARRPAKMPDASREPFEREEFLDKPGIIGARWWQHSLKSPPDLVGRRNAMVGILVAGGCLAALGTSLVVAAAASTGSSDYRYEPRPSLDMQKEYGWSFGATAESLTFDGQSQRPFDRDALAHLADDLRPGRPEHVPWYVPTLFQSPNATPRSAPKEDSTAPTPLKTALVPVLTPAMNAAYRRGKALAALFKAAAAAPRALLVVDLPGPEAIAFAAGAAGTFDPVFALDNWPHPRGVVPAHQALAAAAYYQPLFAKHAAPGGATLPMMVLDRTRLNAYTDDAAQFDNRHVARVPGAPALAQLGIAKVLYVAPTGGDKELDDLNDDFVLYAKAGIDVKLVGADAFAPDPSEGPAPSSTVGDDDRPLYYYGGNAPSNAWFWHDYPWIRAGALPAGKGPTAPLRTQAGIAYVPVARATPYSSGAPGLTTTRPRPPSFGTVPVVVSVATGLVLGARLFRNGSWNRASGGWGG